MSAPAEKRQRFKYVDFDLPFLLFVKDSLGDKSLKDWAEAFSAGTRPLPYSPYAPAAEKPGSLIIGGAFPVYVPPEPLARHYQVAIPDLTVGLRLLRRVNPHAQTVMMGELPGDRTGKASFSSVRVMFDMTSIRDEHHQNFPLFCRLSVQAINHFIAHYRVIANRPYINSITMQVVQSFIVTTEFEDGEQRQQRYGTASGPLHGMGASISDSEDDLLRRAVAVADPPSLDQTLDANIRDCLDLQDWRLVVIESAVAFEAWATRVLRRRLEQDAVSDIEQRFLDSRGRPRSITSIAQRMIEEVTGFAFGSTAEFTAWALHVRDLRNEVVHGKRFHVTQAEAIKAYETVKLAIAAIKIGVGGA